MIIGQNKKNIYIYSGYYHSCNLTYILETYYNYKKIFISGNTSDIEKKNYSSIKNCIYINKKIFN
mgnify:CR=1 FL=1